MNHIYMQSPAQKLSSMPFFQKKKKIVFLNYLCLLHTYHGFQFSIFMGFLCVQLSYNSGLNKMIKCNQPQDVQVNFGMLLLKFCNYFPLGTLDTDTKT